MAVCFEDSNESFFFVKRSRTEKRKNATSRSNFDKYLDYLANEDRKNIPIKSALSLNKYKSPCLRRRCKNVPAELLSKVLLREIYLNKGYGSVRFCWYCLCDRYEIFFKSKGPRNEFWRHSMQRIEKNLEKKDVNHFPELASSNHQQCYNCYFD